MDKTAVFQYHGFSKPSLFQKCLPQKPYFFKTHTVTFTAYRYNLNQYRYRLPPLPKILTAKPHRQKFQYRYRYRYRESGFTASGFSVKPPRCRPLVSKGPAAVFNYKLKLEYLPNHKYSHNLKMTIIFTNFTNFRLIEWNSRDGEVIESLK